MAARYGEELDALGNAMHREFDGTATWGSLKESERHEWRQRARRVVATAGRIQAQSQAPDEGVPSESLRSWAR